MTKRDSNNIYQRAQKMLVGSVLVYPDSLDEVISIVSEEDFNNPALSVIYASIADLTRSDQKVSAVSVAADLESKGRLEQVGGYAVLEELRYRGEDWVTQIPPRTTASLIKDGSVKNSVNEILQESKETLKADSGISAREGIETMQHSLNEQLYSISDETTITKLTENVGNYIDLIDQRREIYEQNKDKNGGLQGIPSNIESLNKYTTGWLPGQLITVAARTAVGKALSLDTPIPTPFGWTTMGDITVGDNVLGMDGNPTNVVFATEVQYDRKCYEVEFSDGSTIIADADHLWLTESIGDGVEAVRTTAEILDTLLSEDNSPNHSIRPATKNESINLKPKQDRFYITKMREVESVPVRCIQVNNEDHMYLAGKSMIPTHNTVAAVNFSVAAARANKSVMFFSLEMGADEIQDRIFSSISSIPMKELKQGNLSDESKEWFDDGVNEFKDLKVTIDVDPEITVDNIRAKAIKQAQSQDGLDLIVVDYLQLISPVGRYNSRQEAVRDLSRGMKLLAKQMGVPIIVLAQVNKANEDAEDDTPRMDQIRESYSIAQDSDVVLLLHRNTDSEDPDPKTYMILEKNRNGESNKVIVCRSDLACSKFEEIRRFSGDDGNSGEDSGFEMSDEEYYAGIDSASDMFDGFEDTLDDTNEPSDDGLENLSFD